MFSVSSFRSKSLHCRPQILSLIHIYTHAEVASLDPQTMRTLCEEYLANNYIDPETSERLGVKRGLRLSLIHI